MAERKLPADFSYDAFVSYRQIARDAAIADRLQSSVQRFARPFWKLRALRLYRDRTSLEVTEDLWNTIRDALDRSAHLIVIASPESAASPWVGKEIDYWLNRRGTDGLILVLVRGSLKWDQELTGFDTDCSDALPPALLNRFEREPLWIDLSWLDDTASLAVLSEHRFLDAVATLGSKLHGRPKDELAGEDVWQLRLRRRLTAGAVGLITAGFASAVLFAFNFLEQRDVAREREREATGRQLAVEARLAQLELPGNEADELAAALALEAWRRDRTSLAFQVASQSLGELPLVRIDDPIAAGIPELLKPVGQLFVVRRPDRLEVFDTQTGVPQVEIPMPTAAGFAVFQPIAERVAFWEQSSGGLLADARSGEILADFGATRHMRFSSDGRLLAVASVGQPARIHDVSTGKQVLEVPYGTDPSSTVSGGVSQPPLEAPPTGGASHVSMDEAARLLASGGDDGIARVTEIGTGETLIQFQMSGPVTNAEISPDGLYLVLSDRNGNARLISLSDGTDVAVWQHGTFKGSGIDFFFEPEVLVTHFTIGSFEITDLKSGELLVQMESGAYRRATVYGPEDRTMTISNSSDSYFVDYRADELLVTKGLEGTNARYVVESPDRRYLVFLSEEAAILVYRPTGGVGETALRLEAGSHGRFEAAAFSPDGRTLAISQYDGPVHIVDVEGRSETAMLGHEPGTYVGVGFNPSENRLITVNANATRVYQMPAGPEILHVDAPIHPEYGTATSIDVAFDPGGSRIVMLTNNAVAAYDIQSGTRLWEVTGLVNARALRISPDGSQVATSSDRQVRIFDFATGAEVARGEEGYGFVSLEYSLDGSELVSHSIFGFIAIIDTSNGETTLSFPVDDGAGVTAWGHQALFSPDGTGLYASSSFGVGLFDTTTGQAKFILGGENDSLNGLTGLAVPDEGTLFAAAFATGEGAVIDAATQNIRVFVEGLSPDMDPYRALDISSDGSLVAIGRGTSVLVFGTADLAVVSTSEFGSRVTDLQFLAGGDRLLTTSEDATARLIDVATGREIARYSHSGGVASLAISDDGTMLSTIDRTGSVRVFNLDEDLIFERLCRERAGRNLSATEWLRHFGNREQMRDTCPDWSPFETPVAVVDIVHD